LYNFKSVNQAVNVGGSPEIVATGRQKDRHTKKNIYCMYPSAYASFRSEESGPAANVIF